MSFDDLVGDGSRQSANMVLFLSIVVLLLLLRFFSFAPSSFDVAIFSCLSMPATYALTYYSAEAYRAGRFVRVKKPESADLWKSEAVALLGSFAMGYLVYVAMSGSTDVLLYVSAFIVVQVIRIATHRLVKELAKMGVDVRRPLVSLVVSSFVALLGFVSLAVFFMFF